MTDEQLVREWGKMNWILEKDKEAMKKLKKDTK